MFPTRANQTGREKRLVAKSRQRLKARFFVHRDNNVRESWKCTCWRCGLGCESRRRMGSEARRNAETSGAFKTPEVFSAEIIRPQSTRSRWSLRLLRLFRRLLFRFGFVSLRFRRLRLFCRFLFRWFGFFRGLGFGGSRIGGFLRLG